MERFALSQSARDAEVEALGTVTVWSTRTLGTHGDNSQSMLGVITSHIDKLIIAYLRRLCGRVRRMIHLVISLAVGFLLTDGVSAQTLPVEVQRVYDGDTITAATVWPRPGIVISTAIRIRGIDAPRFGAAAQSRAPWLKRRAPCFRTH